MGSPRYAFRILGLFAWTLFIAPVVQAQGIVGVDVFLHFAVPLDGPLEKTVLSILHDADQQAPIHVADDHRQAKFTPTQDHDLLLLAGTIEAWGIPLVGFSVMWPDAPTFLSRTPNGLIPLSSSSGPTTEQMAVAKAAWIAAFPAVYERLCKGPVSAPVIE